MNEGDYCGALPHYEERLEALEAADLSFEDSNPRVLSLHILLPLQGLEEQCRVVDARP